MDSKDRNFGTEARGKQINTLIIVVWRNNFFQKQRYTSGREEQTCWESEKQTGGTDSSPVRPTFPVVARWKAWKTGRAYTYTHKDGIWNYALKTLPSDSGRPWRATRWSICQEYLCWLQGDFPFQVTLNSEFFFKRTFCSSPAPERKSHALLALQKHFFKNIRYIVHFYYKKCTNIHYCKVSSISPLEYKTVQIVH